MFRMTDGNPAQVTSAPSPVVSRILLYVIGDEEKIELLKRDPGLRYMKPPTGTDEGFYENLPTVKLTRDELSRSLKLPLNRASETKLEDATNVVILSNLFPEVRNPQSREPLAKTLLESLGIFDAKVKRSKLPGIVFIYNLSDSSQRRLASYVESTLPGMTTIRTMGILPERHIEDATELLLSILRTYQCEQMSYRCIYDKMPRAYLILTEDFPFDHNRLVEVNDEMFHGIRLRTRQENQRLDSRHKMLLISVRRLAPFVHQMISTDSRDLDQSFLNRLERLISEDSEQGARPAIIAYATNGEAIRKPLEHLITCVPGVEVIWNDNRKVIRKLELPERNGIEQNPAAARAPSTTNTEACAVRQEQDIVKTLSDILKKPSNLYMSIEDLGAALRLHNMRPDRALRQFIMERPKHFQILGEVGYEVVTLSHRAQIKRVCNDLQKVLRPRKPKCISSNDIAAAFSTHWKTTTDAERVFDVEDFGVCYLDDLLVTIPQHWGVHCSEYVSTDGDVVRRDRGDGEEQIPDFVPSDATDRVYAWIPRHHQSEAQKKALALLKQQTLNMFRGDPTAEILLNIINRPGRHNNPECNRLYRLAILRAHRQLPTQASSPNGRDNPMLPCNFELEEKTFVPLYHRFCGEQVTLANFGVKDLYELFDSMQDTFMASGHGQERTISLTAEARREILERRIIYILREKGPCSLRELLHWYRDQPTMSPFFDQSEIQRAIENSKFIRTLTENGAGTRREVVYQARDFFDCKKNISACPAIEVVLKLFMLSYAPLSRETLNERFLARTGRSLDSLKFCLISYLEGVGAIRRVNEYEEKYDLNDICRVVRNMVYQMNEYPNRIYAVSRTELSLNPPTSNDVQTVLNLLSFSGDYTYMEPDQLLGIMRNFDLCFEEVALSQFRLRPEFVVQLRPAEETETVQSRRTNRGAHQTFRAPTRGRQSGRFQRHVPSNSHYQRSMPRSGNFGNNGH